MKGGLSATPVLFARRAIRGVGHHSVALGGQKPAYASPGDVRLAAHPAWRKSRFSEEAVV